MPEERRDGFEKMKIILADYGLEQVKGGHKKCQKH